MMKMIKHLGFTAASITLLVASAGQAAQYDFTESFDSGLAEGWDRYDPMNQITSPISVVDGALEFTFGNQSIPFPEATMVRATSAASGGAFAGDYFIAGITSISVRVTAVADVPADARLQLEHTGSGRKWYVVLGGLEAASTMDYSVEVGANVGWRTASNDAQTQFLSDLEDIAHLSIRITRGSVTAHAFRIDDVGLQGIPPYRAVSGFVSYSGDASGDVRVLGAGDADSWIGDDEATAASDGSYELVLGSRGDAYVKAYLDANGNGSYQPFEPSGQLASVIGDLSGDITHADFGLTDRLSEGGLPWWWLNRYFGMTEGDGGAGAGGAQSFGLLDSDGDGATNFEEYRALTNPSDSGDVFEAGMSPDGSGGVVLTWRSAANRSYRVWRAVSLTSGFTELVSDVPGTPPMNTFQDTNMTGTGPYFYRVEVQ